MKKFMEPEILVENFSEEIILQVSQGGGETGGEFDWDNPQQ